MRNQFTIYYSTIERETEFFLSLENRTFDFYSRFFSCEQHEAKMSFKTF